jgi:hypothetical protein
MFALFYVTVMLIDELEWWLRCSQLRIEAREGADRLVNILGVYIEQRRTSLYAKIL